MNTGEEYGFGPDFGDYESHDAKKVGQKQPKPQTKFVEVKGQRAVH